MQCMNLQRPKMILRRACAAYTIPSRYHSTITALIFAVLFAVLFTLDTTASHTMFLFILIAEFSPRGLHRALHDPRATSYVSLSCITHFSYSIEPSVESSRLPMIRMIAPPRRDDICAKGMSSMRSDAESTATSPVPPMFDMHRPAVIPASTG